MNHHIPNHVTNMIIFGPIKNMPSPPFTGQDAGCFQQPQMMTDQRRAETKPVRQDPGTYRLTQAGIDNPQATGIAQQMKYRRQIQRIFTR